MRIPILLALLLPAYTAGAADLIFFGPNIVTVDPAQPRAEAVAVSGEKIVAVGGRDRVLALKAAGTRVVDLGDRALVPGFIDAHGHMSGVGAYLRMVNLSSPPVGPVRKIDDLVALLAEHLEESDLPSGDWVFGYGYDDSLIAENRHPDRDDLDRASAEHPVALIHVSGHLMAVNSAALGALGMDQDTPDPAGGVIRRRPGSTEPDGVLEEAAIYPFRALMQRGQTPSSVISSMRAAAALHAGYGITTVQDGGVNADMIGLYRQAASEMPFPVDVVAYRFGNGLSDDALGRIQVDRDYRGGFRIGGVKFLLDGSPQGRTAYLSKPYTQGPPGAAKDYRAYPVYEAQRYNRGVLGLIDRGVPFLAHANGDAAIDMMIEGVARAVEGKPLPDHRSVIIHAQLMREDQLHRVKVLGLVPSYYAAHPYFWGDWHRRSFGEARAAFISPVARTAELGIPFTIHNDAPVVPPDVMRLLWITVNRKTRSGHVLGADQRATPMQALHAVTLGAAYQYFEEDSKGSITPGKQADLVVLGANPMTVNVDSIKDIRIIETFSRGRSVFRRQ